METVRLRVKDLDLDHRAVVVRNGKGGKDRIVTLPDELIVPLKRHLQSVRLTHEKDLNDGFGDVYLPHALAPSTRPPAASGRGNTCSRRGAAVSIQGAAWSGAIISTRTRCKER